MLLDKSVILDVDHVHGSADIDPISDQCHKRSHYERGEQVHVQFVPWVSQFSKRELIDGSRRNEEKKEIIPEQRENDHRYDQHGEGRGISNLGHDPDDRQPSLTKLRRRLKKRKTIF